MSEFVEMADKECDDCLSVLLSGVRTVRHYVTSTGNVLLFSARIQANHSVDHLLNHLEEEETSLRVSGLCHNILNQNFFH